MSSIAAGHKIKIQANTWVTVVTCILLCTVNVSASENFTRANVNKSQQIISDTIEAYGGAENLQNLNQIIIEYKVTTINVGQSVKTEEPWDLTVNDRTVAFDFENLTSVTTFSGQGGGGRFSGGNIVNGEDSVNVDHLRQTLTKVAAPDFDTLVGPSMRSNGILLIKRLQQFAGSARHLGTITYNDRPHDLIGFTMPGGPAITLYIDEKTHLISKSERIIGAFLVEYYFEDYKEIDGLKFPTTNYYTVDGARSQTFKATDVKFNQSFEKMLEVPENYVSLEANEPQSIATQTLAEGVFLVTNNGQNSLFVEFEDHLMMVGGLAGVEQRIEQIAKQGLDKPVKYTVMTHHHADHIGGSQEVFDANVTFIAASAHQKVIREALAEEDQKSADFKLISTNKEQFKDSTGDVTIYDIGPTPHAEHFLLAYIPSHGIIFEADHFFIPQTGPFGPRTANLSALVKAIKDNNLTVKMIASAHSPRVASFEDMMTAYNLVR